MANLVQLSTGKRVVARELRQPIYDSDKLKAATAASQAVMFSTPQGHPNSNGDLKSEVDTSMAQAGMLPNGQMFALRSWNFKFHKDVALADAIAIYYGGVFEFRYGAQNVRLQVPLHLIPGGNQLSVPTDNTADASHFVAGYPSSREEFLFTQRDGRPHVIDGGQQFNVRIFWPVSITPAAASKFWVIGNGILYVAL